MSEVNEAGQRKLTVLTPDEALEFAEKLLLAAAPARCNQHLEMLAAEAVDAVFHIDRELLKN